MLIVIRCVFAGLMKVSGIVIFAVSAMPSSMISLTSSCSFTRALFLILCTDPGIGYGLRPVPACSCSLMFCASCILMRFEILTLMLFILIFLPFTAPLSSSQESSLLSSWPSVMWDGQLRGTR